MSDSSSPATAGCGAIGALYSALMAVVDAGDEVLIPDPGWPNYEAITHLAGGKPVIASDLPGLDDVVTDEVNGIIAPSDDLSALADAVIGLLEDEGRRARLTRGAEAADLSEWDADRMGERVEAVYRDIIAVQRLNSTR